MSRRQDSSEVHEERQRRARSRKAKYERVLYRISSHDDILETELAAHIFKNLQNASSEMIRRLLQEFDSPTSAFVLAAKLISLGMKEESLWALLSRVHELKYATHEKQPLSTSILIIADGVDPNKIGRITSAPSDGLHISEESDFLSFAECANAFRSTVVMRSTGEVLGIYSFHRGLTSTDCLLPDRYRAACGASAITSGLLFLFAGNGRVCVFQSGHRILSHRGTTWHVHTDDITKVIRDLSVSHSLDLSLITEIMRLAFRISDEGSGALITVGDQATVLGIYEPKKKARDLSAMRIGETPDEDLVLLMSRDGATIVASDWSILAAEGFLRPPAHTRAEQEAHRGSRHNTAVAVSAITKAVCVAVSIDGSVSIYSQGKKEWSG